MKDITHSGIRFTLKTLAIAGLLAVSGGAKAAELIGTMANQSGGEILLTDDKCGAKGDGRITMATSAGGQVSHIGCAHPFRPDRILVGWGPGSTSVLSMALWAPNGIDRSLKSFSRVELDMFFARTAWFNGSPTAARILAEELPAARPAVIRREIP